MTVQTAIPRPTVDSGASPERILHLDFETCNDLDLQKVGADVYSRHRSMIITVLAWAFDDGPVEFVTAPPALPIEVEIHLRAGGRFKAWNAAFEQAILENHYGLELNHGQAVCTMQAALHSGLPASLSQAGKAIGSEVLKDAAARRLMLQLAKPRQLGRRYWHIDEPGKLETLRAYCTQDVETERAISKLIAPLPPAEEAVSRLDRAANARGVRLDLRLIARFQALAEHEIRLLADECGKLTNGAVSSPGAEVGRLLAWLRNRGVPIPNLARDTVEAWLAAPMDGTARRVLEIRQEIAKSSLKKLDAMERCAGPGDRVRQQLAYYGAFRTGRFAGRLIQPQNFPRPIIKDVDAFIRHADAGSSVWWIRDAFGKPLDCIASALRGCLIPAEGHSFVIYDLSQIEARVIAWLAGQGDILEVFARGEDVYVFTQKRIGLKSRSEGKTVVLGLGFGMGWEKFIAQAAKSGLILTEEQSRAIVTDWRRANPKITALWWNTGDVVKELLAAFRGKPIGAPVNTRVLARVGLSKTGRTLMTIRLPSGRNLYYRDARLAKDKEGRDNIVYSGVNPVTKQWGDVRTYGAKIVENITQATARDVIIEAALRIDERKLGDFLLSVHDEIVFEVPTPLARASAVAIKAEVDRRPAWAPDLPVASEGGVRRRYGK